MSNATITIVGNLVADPELRFTQSGASVANITIASTPRIYNKQKQEWEDGEALFLKATAWKDLAEHINESLGRGSRVIATGKLAQKSYTTKEGEKRSYVELEIEEIGPSLKYANADVKKARGTMQGDAGPQNPWG